MAQMLWLALETLRDAEFHPISLQEHGISGIPYYAQLKHQIVPLRKVAESETGCNLFFSDDFAVLDLDQPGFPIGGWQAADPNFPSLIDAIITWVVNPKEAFEMYMAGDDESVDSFDSGDSHPMAFLTVTEQLLGIHLNNEELKSEEVKSEDKSQVLKSFCPLPTVETVRNFTGFNPEEEDF